MNHCYSLQEVCMAAQANLSINFGGPKGIVANCHVPPIQIRCRPTNPDPPRPIGF